LGDKPRQQTQQQTPVLPSVYEIFSCVVNILTSFETAMAQVPTPPLSREVSVEPVKVAKYVAIDKVQELDNLLERYLQLIDNYQAIQKKLGKNLSSVCFLQFDSSTSLTRSKRDFFHLHMPTTVRPVDGLAKISMTSA
jgi:hypothetical protein